MKRILGIIFDFNGTLADTATVIVETMTRTFRDMGCPVPSEDAMRHTIGMKLLIALAQFGNLNECEASDALERYKKIFKEDGICRVALFPEVAEVLRRLREAGLRLAIATSRDADSLVSILKRNGVEDCFETFVSNDDRLAPKPDPQMVLTLLERMGLSADETVVVGDTTFDIDMGNGAGCTTCAVSWGNHDRKTLADAKPDFTIDSFSELPKLIKTFNKQ